MLKINHLELFAGIGGFRQAMELLASDYNFTSHCVGFSEIDPYAVRSYKSNFSDVETKEIGDIIAFNEDPKNITSLPDFDLLTGGFPCQSFSMMGKQKGFLDKRGNVFFEIIKILEIKKPKFVLLENVRNLTTHNKGETIKIVLSSLKEAGYKYIHWDVFDTNDFGLAQRRNRVYIFASREKLDNNFAFSKNEIISVFKTISKNANLERQKDVLDILEKEVDKSFYLSEIIKPTILADGSASFKSKSEINCLIAKPLTATMVKMHRACQDNYYSIDFINSPNPYDYLSQKFSKEELKEKEIRKLTPKEAYLLQGFSENFFNNAKQAGVSNHQLYKQAGNAASVNTIYAILYYLFIYKKINEG
ncbi:DNA (cytosine-5-)-methyltransferase [Sphaerochaeta sp. S2]|uniref:DNA (cytosine-5-)-methyltransferase n=1 Tax=Sphaerochaeta sp. S2 TaxID=2798868 RepID=UPI001E372BA7|nr:DNA (cytosine-5-)-methyltransferase [Sphaerochaeta sp. S2]